ncbi:hypothetical protein [Geotalea daltonii]
METTPMLEIAEITDRCQDSLKKWRHYGWE